MNNNRALFFASFLTLIAAGFGFAVRGAILGDWGTQFDFTKQELGTITGMGFVGGGIAIIVVQHVHRQGGLQSHSDRRVCAPRVFGRRDVGRHACSFGDGQERDVLLPLLGHVHVFARQRTLRDCHQPARGHALSTTKDALFEHAARRLAGRPDSRWCHRVSVLRIKTVHHPYSVGGGDWPIPGSDPDLRRDRAEGEIPDLGSARAAGVSFGTMLLEFASPVVAVALGAARHGRLRRAGDRQLGARTL